jgi:hypothetical protein
MERQVLLDLGNEIVAFVEVFFDLARHPKKGSFPLATGCTA